MPQETEQRLRSWLDTNQAGREALCLGLLAQDARFAEVRPRHPKGGPDGGRDIDAIYRGKQVAAAAVAFVNGANDSLRQKREIKAKFAKDLKSATAADSGPEVFVFMTNLALTMGEQDELRASARAAGFRACEIFDRELMRTMLDSPDGLALRFQYLHLPLSNAEQASFFARWGDEIQSLVTSSFQRVEQTLERLLFLHEANDVLEGIHVHLELDRCYTGAEIGHFRAFVRMFLREPKHRIFQVLFGAADRPMRFRRDVKDVDQDRPGIEHGIAGGAWEMQDDRADETQSAVAAVDPEASEGWTQVNASSAAGRVDAVAIPIEYDHDQGLIRYEPRMRMKDLQDAGWILMVDARLAAKLEAIHIYANGYKLDEIRQPDFQVRDEGPGDFAMIRLHAEELDVPWAVIRPSNASFFRLRFFDKTPVRYVVARRTDPTMDYLARKQAAPRRFLESKIEPET